MSESATQRSAEVIERLEASSLLVSYLAEMIVLLRATVSEIDAAKSFLDPPPPPGDWQIQAKPEFHDHLQRAFLAAGSFMHFVDAPDPATRKKATVRDYVRAGRAAILDSFLRGADVLELRAVEVRNRLEHIDEHLDRIAIRLPSPRGGVPTWLGHNIIVSSADVLDRVQPGVPNSIALRLCALDEDRYYHLGASNHVGTIRWQAQAVQDVLVPLYHQMLAGDHGDPEQRMTSLAFLQLNPPT